MMKRPMKNEEACRRAVSYWYHTFTYTVVVELLCVGKRLPHCRSYIEAPGNRLDTHTQTHKHGGSEKQAGRRRWGRRRIQREAGPSIL